MENEVNLSGQAVPWERATIEKLLFAELRERRFAARMGADSGGLFEAGAMEGARERHKVRLRAAVSGRAHGLDQAHAGKAGRAVHGGGGDIEGRFASLNRAQQFTLPGRSEAESRDPGRDKALCVCPWFPDRTPAFARLRCLQLWRAKPGLRPGSVGCVVFFWVLTCETAPHEHYRPEGRRGGGARDYSR